jgi:hypothetical protein
MLLSGMEAAVMIPLINRTNLRRRGEGLTVA